MQASQRSLWTFAAAAVAIGSFFYFARYRVGYIGGCDASAYLLESWRLRGVDVGLARDPSVPYREALVPLCMVEHAGVVRSFFPPGFPLLLAAAGLLGLELYVVPMLGALSGFLVFLLARARAGPPIALATMVAWLATPLLLWGSTQIMSDLPATTFLLGALFLADQKRTFGSGVLVGLAIGVRPETVLFLPALVWLSASRAEAPREGALAVLRKTLPIPLGVGVAGLGWLGFLLASFGSARVPYTSNLVELNGENFVRQAAFLMTETARQHAPVVALAVVTLVRSPRRSLPYLVWFAPFVVLHALWRVPYEAWWHARFVFPALPALFLLAAIGAAELRDAVGRSDSDRITSRVLPHAVGGIVLAAYVFWCSTFTPSSIHRVTDWNEHYAQGSRRVAAIVQPRALVGAVNYSAPLRYYGRVESFFWCHAEAPALIRWAIDVGRPVYAVIEGAVEPCNGRYTSLLPSLELMPVEELSPGRQLVQLRARPGELGR